MNIYFIPRHDQYPVLLIAVWYLFLWDFTNFELRPFVNKIQLTWIYLRFWSILNTFMQIILSPWTSHKGLVNKYNGISYINNVPRFC